MTSGQYSAGYHFLYRPPKETTVFEIKKSFRVYMDEENRVLTVHRNLESYDIQNLAIPFVAIGLLLLLSNRRSFIKLLVGAVSLCVGGVFVWLLFIIR